MRKKKQKGTEHINERIAKLTNIITVATKALKGAEKKQSAATRIIFWNKIFPNNIVPHISPVQQHLSDIFRRHNAGCTNAQQFCFELSVFFIDLPKEFGSISSTMPAPYFVAMQNAFKILHSHIMFPPGNSTQDLLAKANELPPEMLSQFRNFLFAMASDFSNVETISDRIYNLVPNDIFDFYISTLPSFFWLHFSLKYGRPLPDVSIDFDHIPLTLEFIEAIFDIEGEPALEDMIDPDYLQNLNLKSGQN
ncbi:hypothetical protein GPJ56_010982 [Histomonas meleagridis]|uniref:uncharacterized protein n=1 Tax=Histomonas meleagridis TaxID=135588 RepID=UPI003559AA3E|nr:hypothetical protein GPJ56_010982 [Histomonas meleagridis]KAH0800759.1 hypothetical protein GO595_006512 [Histomonas meleagridis]